MESFFFSGGFSFKGGFQGTFSRVVGFGALSHGYSLGLGFVFGI